MENFIFYAVFEVLFSLKCNFSWNVLHNISTWNSNKDWKVEGSCFQVSMEDWVLNTKYYVESKKNGFSVVLKELA